MRIGKLDNEQLEKLVLDKFKCTRPESFASPAVGEDCACLDLGSDLAVLSMDPITASGVESLGLLSVHVNCNDAVCAGAEPVGLLVTLLAPPDFTLEGIGRIADDLANAAKIAGVDVLGGHTEVTDSVTKPITCTAVVARMSKSKRMKGLQAGDALVMTKWAGLEGTALLAMENETRLSGDLAKAVKKAKGFLSYLSIVPEGKLALNNGAHAMHDVTEGGVLGAAYEICYAAGLGLLIDTSAIPLREETVICKEAKVDPLRLLGSGSLLIGCADGEKMCALLKENGIPAAVIGKCIPEGFVDTENKPLLPPKTDALYDAFRELS